MMTFFRTLLSGRQALSRLLRQHLLLVCLISMALLVSLAAPGGAIAAELPGGVPFLLENFDDWVVACRAQNGVTGCVVRQVQTKGDKSQQMLTAELRNVGRGRLDGALLVPFGLALSRGVTVTVDEAAQATQFEFSTCLPGGCLVPVKFDAHAVETIKSGTALRLAATNLATGDAVAMRISLKGLSAALSRAAELAP
ncbi:invasion protein IalB [Neorhizobium galegae]|uniref:invasion associated locus B family protein n=1 Tax=Neorhizobium galegae TaxID=399 RepID=UPI001FD96D12|nr:invasion associated locus B family protein [Neorhizobium galegae]MBP2550503.1 invasion protein IalB [Neorhizobium galegae]